MKTIKRKLLYISIIITSILAVLIYYSKQGSTKTSLPTSVIPDIDYNLMLRSDTVTPTYKDFLNNDLQKACPFYEPSGVKYRDCLVNLLGNREKAVDQAYSGIVRDIQSLHEKNVASSSAGEDLLWPERQYFLDNLAVLYKTWKPYRDALCNTELSATWGGSNQSGYINTCKLYQTAVFEAKLLGWKKDWR
ncbi:MAG: hypothetical protein NT077_01420 [Candidatus Taylorbacteria bacterium]|nr:hypothetical protein [Candidatus Taylorbacteria bacterium]